LEEDTSITIDLSGTDPDGDSIRYEFSSAAHGRVLAAGGNRVTYVPNPDFFGSDRFTFVVIDSHGARSNEVVVELNVIGINDAPQLMMVESTVNSAYTERTEVGYVAVDPDGDQLQFSVANSDPSVATVELKDGESSLVMLSHRLGTTEVTLTVTDGVFSATRLVKYTVREVDKTLLVALDDPALDAIQVTNAGGEEVRFKLAHNGFTSFQSIEQIVDYIHNTPDAYPGQPFERKLWRFLISNVVHDYPLSENTWLMDPLVTINSLGWGFCSNVASAFVRIAEQAGLEGRVWGLGGHVVPEVRVSDGTWQMYDPDLAVYYQNSDGSVASVSDLESQPHLVSEPIDPLHPVGPGTPYSEYVASIYGSSEDNAVDDRFLGPGDVLDGTVVLPPGASLTYPGQWDDGPTGYDLGVPYSVRYFRHAHMTIPSNQPGVISLPWMLRKVSGDGRIRILDRDFDIGDPELTRFLASPGEFPKTLEILSAQSEVVLIFYINAVRFEVNAENDVVLTGSNVWALDVGSVRLPEDSARGLGIPSRDLKTMPPIRP
jgi:hypothetical protein